eukprot:12905443-Ditylum_brightwellii.AAC.1
MSSAEISDTKINKAAKEIFHFGPHMVFDEGGVATCSHFCCVRQYNKEKPDKFKIDFFGLADSKHVFVAHIDIYQGKNAGNIDVDDKAKSSNYNESCCKQVYST